MNTSDMGKCNCGVPFDKHGTCCGWMSAKFSMDGNGIITDTDHPGYGKPFFSWWQPVPQVTVTASGGSVSYENAGYVQPEQKHYGYWQLCPKCDGERRIADPRLAVINAPLTRTCPVCKGEGKLARPVINDK